MHDPKLYRLLRDVDKNKREQALAAVIEGDYMETIERLCKGVRVLEPGMSAWGNANLLDQIIELPYGCEAYWRLHEEIYNVAIRLALFKAGYLVQDPGHKALKENDSGLSSAENREARWSIFKHANSSVVAVGDLAGLRHFGRLHARAKKYKFISLRTIPDLVSLDFSEDLPELEEIWISDCPGLKNLEGLSSLKSLKRLWLKGLPNLDNISVIKYISQLEELRIFDCPALGNIKALSEATNLKTAYFERCKGIDSTPDSWPGSLQKLRLVDVEVSALGCLPQSVEPLLDLRGCNNLKTLKGIEACANLVEIIAGPSIEDCSPLKSLGSAWLHIDFCGSASRELPVDLIKNLNNLSNLKLRLSDAGWPFALGNPELISMLTCIKALDLSLCELPDPSIFLPLSQLEFLKVQPRSEISKKLGGCTFDGRGEIEVMRLKLLGM